MKPKELTVRGLIPRGADHDSLYSGKRLPRTEGWTDVRFVDSCSGDLRRGRFRRVGYCDSHAHCRRFVRRFFRVGALASTGYDFAWSLALPSLLSPWLGIVLFIGLIVLLYGWMVRRANAVRGL